MRINFYKIKILTFFLLFLHLSMSCVFACGTNSCGNCSGRCGVSECTTWGSFQSTRCEGCAYYECYDQNKVQSTTDFSVDSGGQYWSPGGYPSVSCKTTCDEDCGSRDSCISETYDAVCNCDPDPDTPSPVPTEDGGGNDDPPSAPTPDNSTITGTIQEDNGAALSGNICTQATNNPVPINNLNIYSGPYTGRFSVINPNVYTISRSAGSNYTVTLDLSNQTGLIEYICSCPAALDPNNPYVCQYTGVSSPSENINFYLQVNNLSSTSWFQVFGGNLFARNGINSVIPYNFCGIDNDCQAALNVPHPASTNLLSSGFPITNASNSSAVKSYDYSSAYHSYFHLPTRTINVNSYDVNTDLNQLSYDYFYKLAENQIKEIGNGEDLEPLLSDWTSASWWLADDINYIKVNGNVNIDEAQGFNLSGNQKLIVFVDGNLILDDSDTNDSNRKITSVAQGSFLAFFVSGNIIITADVGYELNPLSPSTPTVSNANSNVEGVFVADNDLIIQSKTAIGEVPPDRKFIGAGTFVGWNNVLLNRTFDDNDFGPILSNTQAIENFVYRPDLLTNWPVKLKASTSNWREVDPQFISQ